MRPGFFRDFNNVFALAEAYIEEHPTTAPRDKAIAKRKLEQWKKEFRASLKGAPSSRESKQNA